MAINLTDAALMIYQQKHGISSVFCPFSFNSKLLLFLSTYQHIPTHVNLPSSTYLPLPIPKYQYIIATDPGYGIRLVVCEILINTFRPTDRFLPSHLPNPSPATIDQNDNTTTEMALLLGTYFATKSAFNFG